MKNKNKINYSLSLKLTIIVVLLSATIIFSLTYINIREQTLSLENVYTDKAIIISKALDAAIENPNDLEDQEKIKYYIASINNLNPDILKINVFLHKNDKLILFSSTNDSIFLEEESNEYNYFSYNNNAVLNIPIYENNKHDLIVINPINLSGEIYGTYEILLSMTQSYQQLNVRANNLIMISIIGVFLLIFSLLFLLRKIIVKPIITFRDASKIIGKGNLDTKIKINSKDEIGQLSKSFNKMTEDLKKSRDKIQDYNLILENLLDQKDEFIGQLGHDLKNPLQPLVGLLPVIIQKEKDPQIKEHLEVIYQNVEYMRNLIIKTLRLAKLRSSNIKFDNETINLKDLVKDVIKSHKVLLNEKNMSVENKINRDFFVKADKLRITEVFANLLTNSIKYTKQKHGKIIINALKENEMITISIKDMGIGMTKEQIDKIFDEFYMVDNSKDEMHSSGLGLSITKQIIIKHGGRIWVESDGISKGSTFFFTLKTSLS
jgi:signal transduction histidine kinase